MASTKIVCSAVFLVLICSGQGVSTSSFKRILLDSEPTILANLTLVASVIGCARSCDARKDVLCTGFRFKSSWYVLFTGDIIEDGHTLLTSNEETYKKRNIKCEDHDGFKSIESSRGDLYCLYFDENKKAGSYTAASLACRRKGGSNSYLTFIGSMDKYDAVRFGFGILRPFWIGARADNSQLKTFRDDYQNKTLSHDDPLWKPGFPKFNSGKCILGRSSHHVINTKCAHSRLSLSLIRYTCELLPDI